MTPRSSVAARIAEWDIREFSGLNPRAWLCVESGFSREELKESLLSRMESGLAGQGVIKTQDLAAHIIGASPGTILGPQARQEILRMLLSERRILAGLPELKRLRRRSGFTKRLDRALQSARKCFSHPEEAAVLSERLLATVGDSPVRAELETLTRAYEAWLEASGLWDAPLLLRQAILRLQGVSALEELNPPVRWPETIYLLQADTAESLEQTFWSSVSRFLRVERISPERRTPGLVRSAEQVAWERWHTLDDAAESLAESLGQTPELWDQTVILIPDHPSVRRSIQRALEHRGVALWDPRDPTRLRWDEAIKWALSPLQVQSSDFSRSQVIAWLRQNRHQPEFAAWVAEINARGIRQGLASYSGGFLQGVHSFLSEIDPIFGGKQTARSLSEAHLRWLRQEIGGSSPRAQSLRWLEPFMEGVWNELIVDLSRVGLDRRRAPVRYWLERLRARLEESTPPVERLKPASGVRLHRLGQIPVTSFEQVFFFGLPAGWLGGDAIGDAWFSEREREVLSGEFQVRSKLQVREERLAFVSEWLESSKVVRFLDAHYDWDGRERQTLAMDFTDAGWESLEPRDQGAHPRWVASYSSLRPVAPIRVELGPVPRQSGKPEIRATDLDDFSRCGFRGLAARRWKAWDLKEPGSDLWPESRGDILHEAVKLLLESRTESGEFGISPGAALERAWTAKRPKGLLKGKRTEAYVRSRYVKVLEKFAEKEREYLARAQTRVLSLEGPELRLEYPDFAIKGIPDRIDEHPEGVFILDYKSASSLAKGTEMLEQGYRLQLPFYALAARQQLSREAVGVQFVELNRKGGRSQGLFFKHLNGKEPGKLTQTTSNSKSLVSVSPVEAWARIEEQVLSHASHYAKGVFVAEPKKQSECADCTFSDLCGRRRLGQTEESSDES